MEYPKISALQPPSSATTAIFKILAFPVLVLVLVRIKDHLTIKRILTTTHPYTRDLFLHQSPEN